MKRTLFLSFASRKRSSWDYGGGHAGAAGEKRRRTHYQVLGVDVEAEPFLIEAAYRAVMRRAHPDMGGDTARAQLINEAFRVLRDPVSRTSYDQTLSAALSAGRLAQPDAAPPRIAAPASRREGLISNAYVMLGVVLVVAALLSARESFASAGASAGAASVAALNPQPFWQAPSYGIARLTLALREMRS